MDESSDGKFWPFLGKLFGRESVSARETIRETIREARRGGDLDPDQGAMLLNILRMADRQVQDIMVPRPDIVCEEEDATVRTAAEVLIASGHSRLPIYKDNRDQITGIVHAKDLLKALVLGKGEEKVVTLKRSPFFIPETKTINTLLQEFRLKKNHLAIAIDEYGGTSGLVTFEDVLEEIVGEIEDEHDTPRPAEIKVQENDTLLVAGRALLEDLEDHIGDVIEDDSVETIGGFLTGVAGRVPVAGDAFLVGGFRFTVQKADVKQVKLLLVEPHDEEAAFLDGSHDEDLDEDYQKHSNGKSAARAKPPVYLPVENPALHHAATADQSLSSRSDAPAKAPQDTQRTPQPAFQHDKPQA